MFELGPGVFNLLNLRLEGSAAISAFIYNNIMIGKTKSLSIKLNS